MVKHNAKGGEVEAGARVPILGYRCYRCGHEWRPNDLDILPRVCPKCKNPYWDRPRKASGKRSVTQKNVSK